MQLIALYYTLHFTCIEYDIAYHKIYTQLASFAGFQPTKMICLCWDWTFRNYYFGDANFKLQSTEKLVYGT